MRRPRNTQNCEKVICWLWASQTDYCDCWTFLRFKAASRERGGKCEVLGLRQDLRSLGFASRIVCTFLAALQSPCYNILGRFVAQARSGHSSRLLRMQPRGKSLKLEIARSLPKPFKNLLAESRSDQLPQLVARFMFPAPRKPESKDECNIP